jgi:hypothetical protein
VAQLEHDQLTPSGLVPEPRWSHQRHLPQLAKDLRQGQNLTVHFDCRFVTIERPGFLARAYLGKGEKRIPVSSIQAVQWKPPGALVNGYIEFTVPGGNETRSRMGSATNDARRNESAGSVVSVLAGNAAGRTNTAHQAARGATYLRHLDASPRRFRGGHRGVHRPQGRLADDEDVRAFAGRCAQGGRCDFESSRDIS